MTGDRLGGFAARLVSRETFELAIEPAIADLQHESASGGVYAWARGCAAVWRAMFCAFCGEHLCRSALAPWTVPVLVLSSYQLALALLIFGIGQPGPRGFGVQMVAAVSSADTLALAALLLVGAALRKAISTRTGSNGA